MNQLEVIRPELHLMYDEWFLPFQEDIKKHYQFACALNTPLPDFESVVEFSYDWLYKVCSCYEFGDPKKYLSLEEAGKDWFYECSHINYCDDFEKDVFAVLRMLNLSFITEDGRFHNMPAKEVW